MRRNLLYIALCATSLWAMTACSDDAIVQENNEDLTNKAPIELSVGVTDDGLATRSTSEPLTRAVITDGTNKTLRAFTGNTRLFFAIVAEKEGSSEKKYGFNYGTATGISNPADNSSSAVSHPDDNWLYWDDAYARDSKVSIYSIAVANQVRGGIELTPSKSIKVGTDTGCEKKIEFTTTNPGDPTFTWSIGGTGSKSPNIQDSETFAWQDLVFSNNIADHSSVTGGTDQRLKFNKDASNATTYHKFDKGNLIYYHALTKFTIKIKCGDGFKGDGTDFQFTNNPTGTDNSFALKGFYGKSGTFKVAEGEFETFTTTNEQNYTSIYLSKTTQQKKNVGEYYTLNAYVFPGTDMTNASGATDAFSFIIDGNKYDITLGQLYNAIKTGATNVAKKGAASPTDVDGTILGEGKNLLAGVNYEFTFTVEKTKISGLTAQVVDWENVVADNITPTNARISLMLEERGTAVTSGVDFYRAKDTGNSALTDTYDGYVWSTGYTTDGKATGTSCTDNKWSLPNWYWPDNTTYYHFRALSPTTQEITSGTIDCSSLSASSNTYTDVMWGAPFIDNADDETPGTFLWDYSTTYGFDGKKAGDTTPTHQIYKGIGPTNSTIKLLMFHMMSEVTFIVKTTSGDDKVTLIDGSNKTKIHLEKIKTTGTVAMGNGLVTATGDVANKCDLAMSSTDNQWVYGAIPQSLADVVLVITTPDKNQYEVSMKDVKASSTPSYNNVQYPAYTDNKVDYWYPGVKYTYTFKLSKKKIEDITATILDWEEVEAGDDNVQIK